MGNHKVGQAFQSAALLLQTDIPNFTQEEAIEKLDIVGEQFRGSDAEFDDYSRPGALLGNWITKAFSPEDYARFSAITMEDYRGMTDEFWDEWYDKVYSKFRARYDFW